jgi:S-(hydroxymethyl)glutathione dehydrogenase/alcohol dehydrogenase
MLNRQTTPLEMVESALKLQGGSMGAIVIASQAVRKGGTIQLVGIYGTRYNAFPLGDLFARNITLKMGQAPVIHYIPELYQMIMEKNLIQPILLRIRFHYLKRPTVMRFSMRKMMIVLR